MIDGLRPYTETKPSGLPWLGDVPAHWDVLPLKRIARFKSGAGFPVTHQGGSGLEIPFLKVSDMTLPGNEQWTKRHRNTVSRETAIELGAHIFPANTIIFPKVGGAMLTNKRRMLSSDSCIDNNVMGCTVSQSSVFYGFVFALLQNIDLGKICKPGPVPAIGEGEVGELRIAIPPLDEQRLIVRFLDWHGAQTAKLVRAKKKIIALLNEQKQAIIHRAVTSGLDPNAKLKPSGIPWLGDVPEGWEVRKLGSLFRVVGSGTTPSGLGYYDGDIPWVMSGDLNNRVVNSTKRTVTDLAIKEISALRRYPENSLIIAMYGATIGKTGVLAMEACTNQACCVLASPRSIVNVHYAQMFVNLAKQELVGKGYGGGQPNINAEIVKSLRIPVPPVEQQEDILRLAMSGVEALAILNANREIALIQEFRTRLIADVVTGKLDVRSAAASLPEVTEIAPIDDLVEGDDFDEAADDLEEAEVAA